MDRTYLPDKLMLALLETSLTHGFGPMGVRHESKKVWNLALGPDQFLLVSTNRILLLPLLRLLYRSVRQRSLRGCLSEKRGEVWASLRKRSRWCAGLGLAQDQWKPPWMFNNEYECANHIHLTQNTPYEYYRMVRKQAARWLSIQPWMAEYSTANTLLFSAIYAQTKR